jgi:CDP-glycerol glycerophosphotransferase (TagB/SpsB family)
MAKKKILFCAASPMNYAMFKPIHQRLKQDERIELNFTANHKVKEIYAALSLKDVKIVYKTLSYLRHYDMCICPSFFYERKNADIRVQIFHGVSLKNRAVHKKALSFDKLFFAGEYMKGKFMETWGLAEDDSRFEMIGMPKVDPLVNGSLDAGEIKRALRIDNQLPTVIYAPTRPSITSSSLQMVGEQVIHTIADMEVNFLIKLHDRAYKQWRRKSEDWKEKLARFEKSNVRVIEDYDIIPYLFISDLLVSDISSVINEFCLVNRPIVLYDVPRLIGFHKKKELERGLNSSDLEEWGRDVGVIVDDMDGLKKAIQHGLEHPDEKGEFRKKFAQKFFYKPGTATDRAVEKIYQLLNLATLP